MADQLAFTRLLADADEQHRAALDRHRARVQAAWDRLPSPAKHELAELMATHEYETCVALSAAAGDYWWHDRSRIQHRCLE